jgi:hypothetical protein
LEEAFMSIKALQLTPSRAVQLRGSLLASIFGAFGELGSGWAQLNA